MKKRLVITLVLVGLLAFGAGMGTFAWFTSSATSIGNVFETGTLVIDNPGTLTADMSVDNIYPSWTSEIKTITVHNSGSLDFKYRMSVNPMTGNILHDGSTPLQISVNGGAFKNIDELGYVELGTISAGSDGTFTVQFKLPDEANNYYQDASATFTFVFDAIQLEAPWSYDVEGENIKLENVQFNREGYFIYLTATAYYKDSQGNFVPAQYHDVTAVCSTDGPHQEKTDKNGNFAIKIGGLSEGEHYINVNIRGEKITLYFKVDEAGF